MSLMIEYIEKEGGGSKICLEEDGFHPQKQRGDISSPPTKDHATFMRMAYMYGDILARVSRSSRTQRAGII